MDYQQSNKYILPLGINMLEGMSLLTRYEVIIKSLQYIQVNTISAGNICIKNSCIPSP